MSITERMAAIHIDPAAANNRGDGATAGTAWRDAGELQRRLGRGSVKFRQSTIITLHGDAPAADIFTLSRCMIAPSTFLTIQGTATVVDSGTLSTFTTCNRTTGTKYTVTDSGQDFSPHVGRYLRITAGPRAGAGFLIHSGAGTSAEITTPVSTSVPVTTSPAPMTRVTPASGDAYEIVTWPVMRCGDLNFGSANNDYTFAAGHNAVVVQDLEMDFGNKANGLKHGIASGLYSDHVAVYVRRCRLDTILAQGDNVRFFQCDFAGDVRLFGRATSIRFQAGRHGWPGDVLANSGHVLLDFDELFDHASSTIEVSYNGIVEIGSACVFNRGASRAVVGNIGGTIFVRQLTDPATAGVLWGTGNAGHGIRLYGGSRLLYEPTAQMLINRGLGAGREVDLGGQDVLYDDVQTGMMNKGNLIAEASIV